MTNNHLIDTLSFDRKILGVFYIFLSIQSKKGEVDAFLEELKLLLESADFDLDTDFILISKKKNI